MDFEEAINCLQSEIDSLKNIAYSGAFHDIQMSAVRDNLDSSIKSIIGRRNDFYESRNVHVTLPTTAEIFFMFRFVSGGQQFTSPFYFINKSILESIKHNFLRYVNIDFQIGNSTYHTKISCDEIYQFVEGEAVLKNDIVFSTNCKASGDIWIFPLNC